MRVLRASLLLAMAALAGVTALARPARADDAFLRGPHPFLSENELSVLAGYGVANSFSGLRAGVGYGFQAAGSVWLDLRIDIVDGEGGPDAAPARCPCAKVGSFVDVLAGIKYKLRMNVPVVPYAAVAAGPVYLFPDGASNAFGLAARAAVGARYFLYDWLGFGLELGGLLGGAWVDDVEGIDPALRMLDLAIGAEVQF